MAGGEVCKEIFFRAEEPAERKVRLDLPLFNQKECCFKLPVLAGELGVVDDPLYNDQTSILAKYDKNIYSDVVIVLQKWENGDWVDKQNLENGSLGADYEYGQFSDFGSSDGRLNYVGSVVKWQLVMFFHGEGTYRFKFEESKFALQGSESFYLFEYCLKEYLPHRADCTVRFDWYTKGYRGDFENDQDIWDYTKVASRVGGDGWFNQMRLPDSFFGGNKSSYEREYIRYSNGQQVWISDEQVETYEFSSGMFPAELHDWIKTNILQADRILVTDYNKNNPNIITNKAIKPTSSYEPSWNYNNLKAFVTVEFEQEFQNRKKLRC
jgi:hypothetical protein